ncbi:MAG: carboxypeptidase regulatory-like domain-containing protein, partial [Bacteroidetes bacterium]|nr:carboxypeptidase regulatory-like domain-containing protein [Bacteroidota bacterium]
MIFSPLNKVFNKSLQFLVGSLILLSFLAITSVKVHAQIQYDVKGTVKKSRKKIEGAVITLYKGSTQVTQMTTASNGRFDVKMDMNAEYTLTISKPGHISKKFYFNTKGVPDDRAKEEFGGQDIEVSIFEMPKDPGVVAQINSILSQPMAKFYYDDKIKEIDFDKSYSQSMQDALAKLNQVEQEAIKKAEEEAKNKSAAESAAASKYEAAIIKGDAAFAKKDYTTARAAYTDALSIK